MDNEDKVKDVVALSKKYFLREIIREIREGRPQYDLEQEFVRTKKNRRMAVLFVIAGFIALFAAASIGVTYLIQRESRRVKVDISEFKDVNLRDVLDVAKKNENEMKVAQRELEDMRAEMNQKIMDIRSDADQQVELVNNRQISDADKQQQINGIRLREKKAVEGVESEYNERIMLKEEEISVIQEKIDEYDARLVEQAKEQEEIFNNQARVHDIEMENTVSYYEKKIVELNRDHAQELESATAHQREMIELLKKNHKAEVERLTLLYNPVFSEERINEVLGRDMDADAVKVSPLDKYEAILQKEGVLSRAEYRSMAGKLGDISLLIDRLQDIPYINSVPGAIDRVEHMGHGLIRDYEKMKGRFIDTIEKKDGTIAAREETIRQKNDIITAKDGIIEQYLYSLEYLTHNKRENGYIIDQRNPDALVVYLNEIYKIQDGDAGYVFRKEDEYIATVRFHVSGDVVTVSVVDLGQEDKPIEPFDRILIHIQ